MDELMMGSMVELVMRQLHTVLRSGALPENAQIVIRPIFTWPDGKPAVWITVNCPN